MMYQNGNKPLNFKLRNRVEEANEIFIGIITFHMLFFTGWVSNFELETIFGWSMIIWTLICIIFNLLFIVYFGFHHFWMVRMNQKKQIREKKK